MSSQDFEGLGGGGSDSGLSSGRSDGDGLSGDASGGGGAGSRGLGDEVAGYAAEVRAQFADLPAAESADLLEDLEDHLSEVAAEGTGTLRQRLGAPAAYASELRQAAGLPEPGEGNGSGASRRSRAATLSWWRAVRATALNLVAEGERRIRVNSHGAAVLDFLPSLRPAWWVLRAWVVVRVLQVQTTSVDWWDDFTLVPRVGNSTLIGMLALLAAIPASVYLGRRNYEDGLPRRLMLGGQTVLVVLTAGMALSAIHNESDDANGSARTTTAYVQTPQQGLNESGKEITNLYVYDQSGKLLNGVLVYDQDGTPVSAGPGGSTVDNGREQFSNSFPRQLLQEQWDQDGTAHFVPVPPPSVSVSQDPRQTSPSQGAPQNSATTPGSTPAPGSPSTPGPTPTPSSTPTPGPTPNTSSTPTSTSSSPAPGASTGAQTTPALPSTPNPSGATR